MTDNIEQTRDAFPELRALTEALLTRADDDYLRRQINAAVAVMADRGCLPPVPWPDEDFGIAVWGRARQAPAAVEVSRLAEDCKREARHLFDLAPDAEDMAHLSMAIDRLATMASTPASEVPAGWQPIEAAPQGVRVLLGPRHAPVVGMVSHPEPWQEGETSCCVVHYNGNVLVANYHCSEWAPLTATPASPATTGVHDFAGQPSVEESLAALVADQQSRASASPATEGEAPAKMRERPNYFDWGLHPRTADLVLRFSYALAQKLAAAERKYGYSDGWADANWMDECREKLMEHIDKGDPRDVAAYCAFLWHHGASTAAPIEAEAQKAVAKVVKSYDGMKSIVFLVRDTLNEGDLLYTAPTSSASTEAVAWLTVCGPTAGCGAQYAGNLTHCPNCGKVNFGLPASTTVTVSSLSTQAVLTDEETEPLFRQARDMQTVGEKDEWFWFAWGVELGNRALAKKNGWRLGGADHG